MISLTTMHRAGLKKAEFAKVLGISRMSLDRYLKGKPPGVNKAAAIGRALEVIHQLIETGKLPKDIPMYDLPRREKLVIALKERIARQPVES